MAGQMTHVAYTADDTVTYRIRMDTSNAAAAGNTVLATGPRTSRDFWTTSTACGPAGPSPRTACC